KVADSILELESFAPETFDCLVGIDFIEHISKDVAMKFLQQASRVLKNNGILILRMPNGDSPFVGRNLFNDITHQWAYTTVAIQSLLFVSGFSKASFADEAEASVSCCRCVKIPLMKIAQCVFKFLTRAATREQIQYLSPSIFVFARK
ncbi:MAG TPA: class I SAM-dependent methyltransferase, partial [Verrucomicrobiota bacterium]|nr:class I SAM-dependent methyltransferase [Verrucomicrobiota bacterium]